VVVPSLLASSPPTRGVQVLFSENAEMSRENSVLLVPISLDSRDLRGPSMYDALQTGRKQDAIQDRGGWHSLMTADAQRAGA